MYSFSIPYHVVEAVWGFCGVCRGYGSTLLLEHKGGFMWAHNTCSTRLRPEHFVFVRAR